jgi:hypothetical protein
MMTVPMRSLWRWGVSAFNIRLTCVTDPVTYRDRCGNGGSVTAMVTLDHYSAD